MMGLSGTLLLAALTLSPAAGQTIAGDAVFTCPCGATVNCRGMTPAACEGKCPGVCAGGGGGGLGGGGTGFTPGENAVLGGAQAVTNAVGGQISQGITNFLRGDSPEQRAAQQRQKQLQDQRRRQESVARQAAEQQRFKKDKDDLVNSLKEDEKCFCPYGTPVRLAGGGCSCVKNPASSSKGVGDDIRRGKASFQNYVSDAIDVEEVLLKQEERTFRDPKNKETEEWCKLHRPFSKSSGRERAAWEKNCEIEDEDDDLRLKD